jgi:hypothetical protein
MAMGNLNVAKDICSLIMKTLHFSRIMAKVVTTNTLLPQLLRMWQQKEFGWILLI